MLLRKELTCVGHVLLSDRNRIEDIKIKAVQSLPPPSSLRKLQQFLGFANGHRSYIKEFASMAVPQYKCMNNSKRGIAE